MKIEVVTTGDNSYNVTFDGQSYSVSANLQESGERTNIVTVVDGVKGHASVVKVGNSLHLFTTVSTTLFYTATLH